MEPIFSQSELKASSFMFLGQFYFKKACLIIVSGLVFMLNVTSKRVFKNETVTHKH